MLYDEFLVGTGCKDNATNYAVYKDLEILYMNSNKTKEEIYEYGKKLVDNSLTQQQIEFNEGIDRDIADIRRDIQDNKDEASRLAEDYIYWKTRAPDYAKQVYENLKRTNRERIEMRRKIKWLKACKYT